MKYVSFLTLLLMFSCQSKKTIQLPEIVEAEITEVLDVSPVYIFYEATKSDSIEVNKANLISTTNWLINVDKRLTLGQAIPEIILLQEKKRNAEVHKNENSKNFYTCNDTSIKNLGFLDFTSVIYKMNYVLPNIAPNYENHNERRIIIDFKNINDIKLVSVFKDSLIKKTTLSNLEDDINALPMESSYEFFLNFNDRLSFQDYITFKSTLSRVESPKRTINENEFIY